jgi:hypothetical protein
MKIGVFEIPGMQFPHPESEHEAEALTRWNGQGAVQLALAQTLA